MYYAEIMAYSTEDAIERIINRTEGLARFWGSAAGWAPVAAAELLSKARLDWQVSLAKQLRLFQNPEIREEEGALILGWTVLGSLTEGILKLFLSIFYTEYSEQSIDTEVKGIRNRDGSINDPGSLVLEKLRVFFATHIYQPWDREIKKAEGKPDIIDWIQTIQYKRNAVHAFESRDIGTFEMFDEEVKRYLYFLRRISLTFPYPDDEYEPREF